MCWGVGGERGDEGRDVRGSVGKCVGEVRGNVGKSEAVKRRCRKR